MFFPWAAATPAGLIQTCHALGNAAHLAAQKTLPSAQEQVLRLLPSLSLLPLCTCAAETQRKLSPLAELHNGLGALTGDLHLPLIGMGCCLRQDI